MKRRLLLEIEYDGSNTLGFQTQKARSGAPSRLSARNQTPSVQGVLENTLSRFFDQPILIDGAGRTDAGVHATGQVVAFTLEGQAAARQMDKIVRGLNCILPGWIRVRRGAEAPEDFRPRYRATRRRYHYQILDGQPTIHHPFWSRYCHVETGRLDVDSMHGAAQSLLGFRDFRPFSKSEPPEKNTWRQLISLDVARTSLNLQRVSQGAETSNSASGRNGLPATGIFESLQALITVDVAANAFLRSMVRLLVGGLLKVGRGEWSQDRMLQRLSDGDVHAHRLAAAPSCGLTLVEVYLPDIRWT